MERTPQKMNHNVQSNSMGSQHDEDHGADASRLPFMEDENTEEKRMKWWERVMDFKESKKQFIIALPMIIINLSLYLILVVSVMFAGHLGELELAGSTLANSWSMVTGVAFMAGLSGALVTLCGQGFGSREYGMLGIYLQSSCIISVVFSVVIAFLWWYTEPILILLHQSSSVAEAAGLYIKYFIPGIFAIGFIQNLLRFFQTQSVVVIPMIFAIVPLLLHVGIAYVLVHLTGLGYIGAPLAASISLWISLLMLVLYMKYANEFKLTYTGLSSESFRHVIANLKLALPSAAMACLECWAFEILVLLAGLMPNSATSTSLVAMCVNTETLVYMIVYGLSAAASTRVSNELGAGNPGKAKNAMWVTLKFSIILALLVVVSLAIGHDVWAGLFSSSSNIVSEFASMTPLLVISVMLDAIQGAFSGVCTGCGWQHLAMYINLAAFYLIGMPISCLLAFKLKLYAKGLWIGLICGLSCQTATLIAISILKKWTKMEHSLRSSEENPLLA